MAAIVIGGKCVLGCGRKCATHTRTNICSTCLGNLSMWRRRTAADRLRHRARTELAIRRQEEVIAHPKGYALLGRPLLKGKK